MGVIRPVEPMEFLDSAARLLEKSEARHNLIYGVAGALITDPEVYPEHRFWIVRDENLPVAAALRTPPFNVLVADAQDEAAVAELVDAIVEDHEPVPGATGTRPTIDWFAKRWEVVTGDQTAVAMDQGLFALDTVNDVPSASGHPRPAEPKDRTLVVGWMRAFAAEAFAGDDNDLDLYESLVDRRLRRVGGGGLWLWVDEGAAVAMSGHGGRTPSGIRIGPVYTPPEHRGKGYATALVAHQSGWLIDRGVRFCFLYTDLANPTSNAIYRRIGYEQVAESAEYTFTRRP